VTATPVGGLVRAQLEGIQEWITAGATELAVLRGGSRLLWEAFHEAAEELREHLRQVGVEEVSRAEAGRGDAPPDHGYWLPVVASGTLTGVFADHQLAYDAAAQLRRGLRARLPGGVVDVGVAPFTAGETTSDGTAFQQAIRSVTSLESRDAGPPAGVLPPLLPGTVLCAACGASTATQAPPRRDRDASAPWCDACIARQRASQHRGDIAGVEGVELAPEFRDIGSATRADRYRGYMGIIAADGDGVGQRVTRLTTPADLHALSREIEEAVEEALAAALRAGVAARDTADPLPYNPVVRAGDDVCLAVPADVAVPVAAAMATAVPTLPMSAGVLICHDSLPFSTALDAAKDLEGRAKKASRASGDDQPEPHVAFAVESAGAVRAELASDHNQGLAYPARLVDAVASAATGLTMSPHRAGNVVTALREGGRLAEREWRRAMLDEDRASRSALSEVYQQLGASMLTRDVPSPWLDEGRGEGSPFEDLLLLRALRSTP